MSSSILILLATTLVNDPGEYARPDLLAEAADLAKGGSCILLDVRPRQQYLSGHAPSAIWVDVAAWGKAFTPEPDLNAWNKRLGQIGIDIDGRIVIYGNEDVREAARLWWILRYWGLKDVRMMNGGWTAWRAAGGKVATDESVPVPKVVKLTARPERVVTKEQLVGALKGTAPQIVDARSVNEYCGLTTTAKRNGAIPGAIQLEWSDCLDPKTKKFKTAAELKALFRERGIDLKAPVVTYCQSGGRASVMAFALELMGGAQVRNYYRSWSEWGNDPVTPIVQPTQKTK